VHTLAADDETVAEGFDGVEEGLGCGGRLRLKRVLPSRSRTTRKSDLACRSTPA
jgi:hypothetical protein